MGSESNAAIKKLLQKIVNHILKQKDFEDYSKVEVFFVFGSKHKTAMCDWVYGIKIYTSKQYRDTYTVNKLQSEIKKLADDLMTQSVCCTDIIFEKS